jgi:glutathione peroxidase
MARAPIKSKLKKILIVLLMVIIVFAGYVEIVNRNSRNMTYRQKVLKAVYPAWMWWGKLRGKNATELSGTKQPPVLFYSLKATLNDESDLDFTTLKGKKVMLVNTASDCGYTNQYEDLQKLSEEYKDNLVIIGFPANDFKEQEKGTDQEIAKFCKENYGVTFPLAKKSTVIRSPQQNVVFNWLTDSAKNGWNNKPPGWNFTKYIVNENGILTHYFGPIISPMSKDVLDAINGK